VTSRRTLAIQAGVSLVALAGVVWWLSRQRMPHLPSTGPAVEDLLAALAVYAGATLLRGERWHRLLELSHVRSTRGDAYGLTTVGYMGNNTLPARAGDALKVVLSASRSGAAKRDTLGAAVAERLLDAAALAGLFAVLAVALVGGGSLPTGAALPLLAGGLTVLALAGGAVLWRLRNHPRAQSALLTVRRLLAPSRALLSGQGAGLLALSVAIWTTEATVYLLAAHAVGVPLNLLGAMYVVALTNLVALVPAAPGYVGTFDAAIIFAVKAVGGGGAPLAYVIALRLVLFVPITLVGLALLLVRYGGLAPLRTLRPQAATGT